ncbi:hypothetical protein ACP4OV_029120 [Aristida adscensionis]
MVAMAKSCAIMLVVLSCMVVQLNLVAAAPALFSTNSGGGPSDLVSGTGQGQGDLGVGDFVNAGVPGIIDAADLAGDSATVTTGGLGVGDFVNVGVPGIIDAADLAGDSATVTTGGLGVGDFVNAGVPGIINAADLAGDSATVTTGGLGAVTATVPKRKLVQQLPTGELIVKLGHGLARDLTIVAGDLAGNVHVDEVPIRVNVDALPVLENLDGQYSTGEATGHSLVDVAQLGHLNNNNDKATTRGIRKLAIGDRN